ncbi:unnamed protein product [Acanthosepion pharaonis]|uniref:Uncharacterized protein n=1 Tax=Acanthosepion pharaonis TaxID=158019 RepID=A0A812C3W6_ACAPH|nr:unnamed protein product [Sepia pharaonis]
MVSNVVRVRNDYEFRVFLHPIYQNEAFSSSPFSTTHSFSFFIYCFLSSPFLYYSLFQEGDSSISPSLSLHSFPSEFSILPTYKNNFSRIPLSPSLSELGTFIFSLPQSSLFLPLLYCSPYHFLLLSLLLSFFLSLSLLLSLPFFLFSFPLYCFKMKYPLQEGDSFSKKQLFLFVLPLYCFPYPSLFLYYTLFLFVRPLYCFPYFFSFLYYSLSLFLLPFLLLSLFLPPSQLFTLPLSSLLYFLFLPPPIRLTIPLSPYLSTAFSPKNLFYCWYLPSKRVIFPLRPLVLFTPFLSP